MSEAIVWAISVTGGIAWCCIIARVVRTLVSEWRFRRSIDRLRRQHPGKK